MLAKSTEYAIRALVFIQLRNWEEKRPGVIEIAEEIEAPTAFSAKILQTLTRHKLVDSAKGRGGGFFFNSEQSGLTLYQVIHIMEGDTCFHKCGFGLKSCNNANPCPLHEKYKVVRDGFYEIVRTETIHSLADKIRQGKATLNRVTH
ncbi:Rrf2 family transcriptional regulator [uncultured Draconibacterium sp.]|uniref:RrF2 family transcriptional regulator n=1 Tax=uncultured Draconibacterium sp. TaxID=1573823 RepID=UPI0025DB9888|nr:Rrf2 family transcriptional regulator [uncultured Draconibacterium sp.]